jgi:hypothetical protein
MKALMHPFAGVRALEIELAVGDTTWFEETLIYSCWKHCICGYDNLDAR